MEETDVSVVFASKGTGTGVRGSSAGAAGSSSSLAKDAMFSSSTGIEGSSSSLTQLETNFSCHFGIKSTLHQAQQIFLGN